MKKLSTCVRFLILSLIIIFTSNSISILYAQDSKSINSNSVKDVYANYEKNLNYGNRGVRMSVVEIVGRYKISYFEKKLIKMLNNEQDTKDKQIIALSLFQLGSLNTIEELRNSILQSNNQEYNEFCSSLLDKYGEYDKLRSEFFETLVVQILESE